LSATVIAQPPLHYLAIGTINVEVEVFPVTEFGLDEGGLPLTVILEIAGLDVDRLPVEGFSVYGAYDGAHQCTYLCGSGIIGQCRSAWDDSASREKLS
jgi:hypothetical protein